MEHSFGGPFGTLIAGLGLGAFYTALIWINMLLGVFLTPLFLVPLTWVQDAVMAKKSGKARKNRKSVVDGRRGCWPDPSKSARGERTGRDAGFFVFGVRWQPRPSENSRQLQICDTLQAGETHSSGSYRVN